MTDKLQQAQILVSQNKFKKALAILKKINNKAKQQSYLSLELEGVCLINEKKYPLAELTLLKSLDKAENNEQRVNTLANLKGAAYSANDYAKSIGYLEKILAIDPSSKTADYRLQLCQMAYLDENYSKVINFAPKLFALSAYSALSLVITISAQAKLGDKQQVLLLLQKLTPELNQLTSIQVANLVEALSLLSLNETVTEVLAATEEKFAHEAWYKAQINQRTAQDKAETTVNNSPVAIPEARVVGGNQATVNIIETLVEQLESLGAKFHKNLRFIESQGNLSITAYNSEPQKLMSVPYFCMPLLNDFNLSIDGNTLQASPVKSPISPKSLPIMQTMVTLYNQTDKITSWQQCYPLLALKEYPELIDCLFANTKHSAKISEFKSLYDQQQWDTLILKTFLGSREFCFKKEILEKSGIKASNKIEHGLLTVIDFLNHREGENGYQENISKAALEIEAIPDNITHEVFVQYNFIDPVLTYLIYGFVDTGASALFSCINTLKCNTGLEIYIRGTAASATRALEKQVSHLEKFMPVTLKRSNHVITINNLIIPSVADKNTLPQVIANVLKKSDLEGLYRDENQLIADVSNIEKQLITNNLSYWYQLKSSLEKAMKNNKDFPKQPANDIKSLCEFSINHLKNYANAANILLI